MTVAPATDLTPSRRSFVSRLSAGHVVMTLAGLLGALLTLAVLRSADETVAVAVARSDLAPGAVVGPDSFRLADVKVDDGIAATLVGADQIATVTGDVVVRPLRANELVTRALLRSPEAGAAGRSMSFALPRDRAVGGDLAAGDHVDIVAARDGVASYALLDAEVLAVDSGGSGPLRGATGDQLTVTLAVDERSALAVAAALDGSTVTLVRSTGAPVASGEGGAGAIDAPGAPDASTASAGARR